MSVRKEKRSSGGDSTELGFSEYVAAGGLRQALYLFNSNLRRSRKEREGGREREGREAVGIQALPATHEEEGRVANRVKQCGGGSGGPTSPQRGIRHAFSAPEA